MRRAHLTAALIAATLLVRCPVASPIAAVGAPARADPRGPQPGTSGPPFTTHDVSIPVSGARLGATLLIPGPPHPVPAAVIVPGSGPLPRDGGRRFPIYRLIAEHLATRGIAALIYDKRGVGRSSGRWDRETFDDRADDVAALVHWLRGQPAINPRAVGLIGHSQGGYVAPLVADRPVGVAFIVMLAGPAQSVRDQTLVHEELEGLRNGTPPREVRRRVRGLARALAAAATLAPLCRALRAHYICYVVRYDPAPALGRLRVPVLAVFGALDTQVPPEHNAAPLAARLAAAGNPDVTVRVFPGASHWFAAAVTGTTAEFRRQDYVPRFVPGFLETVSGWIVQRFPSGSQKRR